MVKIAELFEFENTIIFSAGLIRCCQTNRLKHQKPGERVFYEALRERHSDRAASRLSLNVLRFESALCELNRLWNEAWIEANFYRLRAPKPKHCSSRRRNGRCEFSALLFAHRCVTCLSEQPSYFAAALYDRSLSVTISLGDPYLRIAFFMNFSAAFLSRFLVT